MVTAAPDVPVLLIGFNRPGHLERVIDHVRPAAPKRVFLAVDGPRPGRPADAELVERTQALARAIDWGCDVRTLFRERNLGCGRGVSEAITWFLGETGEGIILEDDIAPSPAFFDFAARMLERYRDDDRVAAITGTNFVPPEHQSDPTRARCSAIPVVWGWATWQRAWASYDLDIAGWRSHLPQRQLLDAVAGNPFAYLHWSAMFDLMARMGVDTWDIQLVYAAMRDRRVTITPNANLVENFGWGADSTHTQRTPGYLRAVESTVIPAAPAALGVDRRAERWIQRSVYGGTPGALLAQGARHLRRTLRGAT